MYSTFSSSGKGLDFSSDEEHGEDDDNEEVLATKLDDVEVCCVSNIVFINN